MPVVVNGRLYVDDEPYWENLLEEGKTYSVAYCIFFLAELQSNNMLTEE
jgi:hypothetical protein